MAGRRQPRTMLDYLVQSRDQTYPELVTEIEAHGGTITARHLSRLASGAVSTTYRGHPSTRRALQQVFGKPFQELLAPYEPGQISRATTSGGRPLTGDQREVVEMAASRAKRFALDAAQTGLTDEAMEQVYDDVRYIAQAYPQRPLSEILGPLVEAQDTLFTLLEGNQQPNHARQLYFLTGITSGLLAKASHDLANPHAALTQARTANLCAERADHPGLRAWIFGIRSLVSYWAGNPHDSLRFAQAGIAVGAENTTAIWLPVSEARAWGALGNAQMVHDALQRAEDAWSLVHPDDLDALGGICTFGRSRQLYYAAEGLAQVPSEAADAEQYASQAVEAYSDHDNPEWAFGDASGAHTDLAITRVTQGEIEGARDALAPVLELPADRRINGIIASVKHVHQAIRRSDRRADADARDLQEEIESFTRVPMQALTQQ
jgi:hypothetical protein